MTRLYFDTETTGIPNRKLPWSHESQPAIVSIAWIFVKDDWTFAAEYHNLVKPDGWTIDPEGKAFAAHRIPQERCEADGLPIRQVIADFDFMMADMRPREACAYNIGFDIDLITIACEKARLPHFGNWPSRLDIMPLAQIRCAMPPTDRMKEKGFGHRFKPPRLAEALKILCGEEFPDAHDALADVRATIKIHRAIEEFRHVRSSPSV